LKTAIPCRRNHCFHRMRGSPKAFGAASGADFHSMLFLLQDIGDLRTTWAPGGSQRRPQEGVTNQLFDDFATSAPWAGPLGHPSPPNGTPAPQNDTKIMKKKTPSSARPGSQCSEPSCFAEFGQGTEDMEILVCYAISKGSESWLHVPAWHTLPNLQYKLHDARIEGMGLHDICIIFA